MTLVDIRSRSDAVSPNEADFAVVESALITPRETRVLGLPVFRDDGRRLHYLYKGESFRLGDAYYKVNWVSAEPPELAVAQYRSPDPAVPLKVDLD